MRHRSLHAAAVSAAVVPLLAAAQPPAADPLDAAAPVAPLHHRSAFVGYRPLDETERADWREVNGTVDEAARRVGGHAAHPGHAGGGAAPPAPAPAAGPGQGGTVAPHDAHGGAR